MSVAIVCMVNHTAVDIENMKEMGLIHELPGLNSTSSLLAEENPNLIDNEQCYNTKISKNRKPLDGSFNWSKAVQGQVLSAFFYGHIISQVFGAVLSVKFGSIRVCNCVIFIGSVLTVLTPFAARISYLALVACRFILGFAHGMLWPAISTLWSFWAPPSERSTLMSIARSGSQLGNVKFFLFEAQINQRDQ